ncbi:MAG: iron-sulfur cluster assembly scaffold protein [Promethearchaeota archaeon]
MINNFDDFVSKLQKRIIKKDIEEYNKKVVNLYYKPHNWGKPPKEDITIFEELKGGLKNYFLGLYLKIENDNIIKAYSQTDGCGVMVATASQTMILIEGKPIQFAEDLKIEDINKALMGLPEDEKYCIDFAIKTLQNLIKKYKGEI